MGCGEGEGNLLEGRDIHIHFPAGSVPEDGPSVGVTLVTYNGNQHSADQFERLLKEICADEDGDLLIDSSIKRIPKVFVVSTLVNVAPAQPFIFRNYQVPCWHTRSSFDNVRHFFNHCNYCAQVGYKRSAYMGSYRHDLWEAIRASSAAPYYLDDYSDGVFRWKDGAIVANNPTIFAIREAHHLWPYAKIDALVSIGCCSVPIQERCDMELDETDHTVWLKLEASTEEYIQNNSTAFKKVCERLLLNHSDEKVLDNLTSQPSLKSRGPNTFLRNHPLSPDSFTCLLEYCIRNYIILLRLVLFTWLSKMIPLAPY
ncbi:hypothetical protein Lser_V15G36611 [Lactuca serriola]